MTVGDLIARLNTLPQEWEVWATRKGNSLQVQEPGSGPGRQYGFLFTDGRPAVMFRTTR